MRNTSARLFCTLALSLAALSLPPGLAAQSRPPAAEQTRRADIPNDRASIEHALNRLAFGPRAGDVERVERIGLATWIDQQLNPAADADTALGARLPPLPSPPSAITSQREARQFGRQSMQVLASQKLTRAIYGERQLEEVLFDFWFNHFNVFAGKGRTSMFLTDYEREAIRPHLWGSFRDLLGATAKSPAMLFYLDNWLSADPDAAQRAADTVARRRARQGTATPPPAQNAGRRRGLNENYARELLELHTLGVDGGYTQQDIIAVARAFTGWTIGPKDRRARRQGANAAMTVDDFAGEFRFTPAVHDSSDKLILGRTVRGGGLDEGERVLDMLAAHPSTARHIATKLVQRFVSDNPPEALVARVAARFTETNGDLREVVRTVVTAPEFFAREYRGAKTKTPLEFVVSAARASGRQATETRPMLNALQQLGMMPYMCQPPTGYDDAAETWMTAGALVTRMNIAQQLARADAATIGGPAFQRR